LLLNFAKAQIISTVAGNDTAGYKGDGGLAISAELSNPAGVAFDAGGNIYIADLNNNCVRKIDISSGIITTIAGNGVGGYSGDGGLATSAQLNLPTEIAIDAGGNIYIADWSNNVIRKVNTSGIITTFAGNGIAGFSGDGGLATGARLNNPMDLAIDAAGSLLICDSWNNCIRKVNTSGIISTIAGSPGSLSGYSGDGGPAINAQLFNPSDIGLDATGNLFISDANNVIRKVDAGGIITTIAGTGIQNYSGDGGLAINAELFFPAGICFDSAGNLYFVDSGNNVVRKINTSGIITTFAGNGIAGYSGDGGPATSGAFLSPIDVNADAANNIFIAEQNSNVLRKVGYCASPLNLTITGINILCSGDSTILKASGAATYTWSANAGSAVIDSVVVNPVSTTTYSLTGMTGGCIATKSISVFVRITEVNPSSSIICSGFNTDSIRMSGADTYTFTPATGYVTSAGDALVFSPPTTTNYTLIGSSACGITQATFTVTVNPAPVPSFTLQANATPHVWDAYATFTGGTSPYTYDWDWGDGSPNSTTAFPSHTYSVAGFYNICATISDANGCTASFCQNDSVYRMSNSNASTIIQVVVHSGVMGVENVNEIVSQIKIYPNPAENSITVGSGQLAVNSQIKIIDVLGNQIKNVECRIQNGSAQIDVSNFEKGIYFIQTQSNGKVYTSKFVKE
jgi:sugar lactone lactonase YvrE/PKD repeat protein